MTLLVDAASCCAISSKVSPSTWRRPKTRAQGAERDDNNAAKAFLLHKLVEKVYGS